MSVSRLKQIHLPPSNPLILTVKVRADVIRIDAQSLTPRFNNGEQHPGKR